MNQKITLKGISLKGKNRVRELGQDWEIISNPVECQCFNGDLGIMIAPVTERINPRTGLDRARWVKFPIDPDFEWV